MKYKTHLFDFAPTEMRLASTSSTLSVLSPELSTESSTSDVSGCVGGATGPMRSWIRRRSCGMVLGILNPSCCASSILYDSKGRPSTHGSAVRRPSADIVSWPTRRKQRRQEHHGSSLGPTICHLYNGPYMLHIVYPSNFYHMALVWP